MNILFFGSSDYSYECLKAIMTKHNVIGIITHPDKPQRNHKLEPTFLKAKMLNSNIPIYQPINIKNEYNLIKELNPDLIVSAAYGQILSEDIINIPKYKSINFHASLLPKYKGASPIRQVIIDGEEKTGITSIYMDKTIDTGNIILQKEIVIDKDETFDSLYNKFLNILPEITLDTLEEVLKFNKGIPQTLNNNSYTSKNNLKETELDWTKSCLEIDRFIRAYYSSPATFFFLGNKKIKVYKAKPIDVYHENPIGELIRIDKDFIRISCSKGYIDIYELQIPGKRIISAKDFINGNKKWLQQLMYKPDAFDF